MLYSLFNFYTVGVHLMKSSNDKLLQFADDFVELVECETVQKAIQNAQRVNVVIA